MNQKYYSIRSRTLDVKNSKLDLDDTFHTIGWLRIQGTSLDIPLISSDDGLDTSYPVTVENYVWTLNSNSNFHNQMFIIGHNIFNLSSQPKIRSDSFHRFEELMGFIYYDFSQKNKYIQLTINGKDYLYKIFSVGFIDDTDVHKLLEEEDASSKKMTELIQFWKEESIYDYSVSVREDDKLLTLYTCTRFFGVQFEEKFFVTGRLVRSGELIHNYKVSKNNNYKKIETILEGEKENGEDI